MVTNPYVAARDPKKYNVAQLLLSGDTVSWDDLRAVAGGRLSPRTFGFILRSLEAQQTTILRLRDEEHGTLYRHDPAVPYDDRFRLSKADGPDASNNPVTMAGEDAPEMINMDDPVADDVIATPAEEAVTSVDASVAPGPIQTTTATQGASGEDPEVLQDMDAIDALLDEGVDIMTIFDIPDIE